MISRVIKDFMVQGGDFVNVRFLLINNMQTFEAGLVFEKKVDYFQGSELNYRTRIDLDRKRFI